MRIRKEAHSSSAANLSVRKSNVKRFLKLVASASRQNSFVSCGVRYGTMSFFRQQLKSNATSKESDLEDIMKHRP